MNQENTFKVKVRRNWLLGLWPAEKLGLPESLHEAYVEDVALADQQKQRVEDIMRKVMKDTSGRGAKVSEADARQKLTERRATAAPCQHLRHASCAPREFGC